MGLLRIGEIDNIPPMMRRYEEMVRNQKTSRHHETFHDSDSYLGAPIRSDLAMDGVKFVMTPSPDFVPVWEAERVANKELMCTISGPCLERLVWEIGDVRRHGTFMNCHEIVYFPMIYDRHPFQTELSRYLWSYRSSRAKPDMVYLAQLKKCFMSAIQKFKMCHKKIIINNLMLNDSLYCLNWFSHQSKLHIIRILARTLREQPHIKWIAAENTELLQEDGLRLLLAISITSGLSLRTLHLWHFFSEGALPVKTHKVMSRHDPFISYKIDVGDKVINYMFFCFVMRSNYSIPTAMKSLALHAAYACLEYLEVLSVEYRYLTGGQGESMLYLGCIKNGTLRELNILFTCYDYLENTKRYVCEDAWKKAHKLCPCFRVNFVAIQLEKFSTIMPVLGMFIPLEGFYASSGFKTDSAPLIVNRIASSLVFNFKKFLRRLNVYLKRPQTRMDFVISKFLMELPFLEEFFYRGPIENISTLHTILKYIENNRLRMKKFHLYLTEDPCNPEVYIKTMTEIYNQYEPVFVHKGIDFKLGTCQC